MLIVLLAALLACGKLKDKIVEKVRGKAIEEATDGQFTPKVPDDWPAFLTQYPGSKVVVAGTSRITGSLSGSLSMETTDEPEQVLDYYTKLLNGYKLRQDINQQGRHTKVFAQDPKTVTVTAVRSGTSTQATLVVTNF